MFAPMVGPYVHGDCAQNPATLRPFLSARIGKSAAFGDIDLHQTPVVNRQLNGAKTQCLQSVQNRLYGARGLILLRPIVFFDRVHDAFEPFAFPARERYIN